jgi:hypothetical protein
MRMRINTRRKKTVEETVTKKGSTESEENEKQEKKGTGRTKK